MGDIYGIGTLTINTQYCILGREVSFKYGNGVVKNDSRIVGRYDEQGNVFNASNEKIGWISDPRYRDLYLFNNALITLMDCGRARGDDRSGFVDNERHDMIALYKGDGFGAAAAIICAMYHGFLGASYENFFRK